MIKKYYGLQWEVVEGIAEAVHEFWRDIPPNRMRYVALNGDKYELMEVGETGQVTNMVATVAGTQGFGQRGSDIDFGVVAKEISKDELRESRIEYFSEKYVVKYPNQGIIAVCEFISLGDGLDFLAVPEFRAIADIQQYNCAARFHIPAIGGIGEWMNLWRRIGKIEAYEAVGISTTRNGTIYI